MFNPLFMLEPETAHKVALWGVKNGLVRCGQKPPSISRTIAGLNFTSPVGLSAGADKEAYALSGWSRVGFGFVETGTVTLHPREGNPKPRVWRQKQDSSVVNWMGLPGGGLEVFLSNVKKFRAQPSDLILGVSVASPEGNIADLEKLSQACTPYADYLTLNASCPNVAHGADDGDALAEIASHVKAVSKGASNTPVFLKLGPTRSEEALEAVLKIALDAGAAGFVLTNTIPPNLKHELIGDVAFKWPQHEGKEVGGYSGPHLLTITQFMVAHARQVLGADIPLMGVGGIQSAEDAKAIMDAGADLIQIYTGFIYKGPKLVRDINESLKLP